MRRLLRYIPTHEITNEKGSEKPFGLPLFHSFTGCDNVSSFAGRGKKTAFDTWKSFNGVKNIVSRLFRDPLSFNDECMSIFEKYVVLQYDRTCTEITVNSP